MGGQSDDSEKLAPPVVTGDMFPTSVKIMIGVGVTAVAVIAGIAVYNAFSAKAA
jgi:hypothetical protein